MNRIAVLDDWQQIARTVADWSPLTARADVQFFTEPFRDQDDAARQLADFDMVLATRERTPFPAALIARLPRMKMFGLTGHRAGLIDMANMMASGITVCYTGGGPSVSSTAEIALGLMLAVARNITTAEAALRAGRFQVGTQAGPVLAGKTLGLVGLGRIGARMAAYGHALEMKVLAWSPNLTAERAAAAGATYASKAQLLSEVDVVSLHLVLSDRTRGVVGAADLARLRNGAMLINTSRAPLVDEAALMEAIMSRRIRAGLDVFYREPIAADHPLTRAPNVVLTPHLGYSATEVYQEYYQHSVENALAYLDGKPIRVMQPA